MDFEEDLRLEPYHPVEEYERTKESYRVFPLNEALEFCDDCCDKCFEFKGIAQRENLEVLVSGNHIVGVVRE